MTCLLSVAALGSELRAVVLRRQRAGEFSVHSLARRSGVSQPQVANWLAGRRALSSESVDAIRCALRIGICELLHCDDCRSLAVAGVVPEVRRLPAAFRVLVAIDGERAA